MKKKYLNILPEWYSKNEKYDLVMSDDIDALLSVSLLNREKGWKVNYFYNFDALYQGVNNQHTRVWCDVAYLGNEPTFDNHVSRTDIYDKYNLKCINPNLLNGVTSKNYTDKYAGSTALLIWSIYDIPLPKTEEGKMLLLCVDSAFKGFYKPNFKDKCIFYIRDMFGFDKLIDVMNRHSESEFYAIIEKYNLTKKIIINNDGTLYTTLNLKELSRLLEIELVLPDIKFNKVKEYKQKSGVIGSKLVKDLKVSVETLAFIYRNKVVCSIAR